MESEKQSNCVICLEPISTDAGITDCGHMFCAKCIKHWCDQCSSCPLCRKEITLIKLFYRSFYLGQDIHVEQKKQVIPNNNEPLNESDFITSDSEEILVSSQDALKDFVNNSLEDVGTIWTNGSRHSLRKSHRPNQAIEQRLTKLKIQLKNEKSNQEKIKDGIRFLISYVENCINSNKLDYNFAEYITDSVTDQIKKSNGSINNAQIKRLVESNFILKSSMLNSNRFNHVRRVNRI